MSTTTTSSRRAILTAAAGAAVATVAGGLARPLPAIAADGDAFLLGQQNAARTPTVLNGALQVSGTEPAAIYAHVPAGQAVIAISDGSVSWTDCGVYARVSGDRACAIVASHSGSGTALYVNGKAKFVNRSGRAIVPSGTAHVDIDLRRKGGLTGTPLGFANLMDLRPGIFVTTVRPNYPSSGVARIYLNRAVASDTSIAWFVLG